MLLIDKYRPKKLDDLPFYSKQINLLKKSIEKKMFLNMIFYGKNGVNLEWVLNCFLNDIYGETIYNKKKIVNEIKKNFRLIENIVVKSKEHIELYPTKYSLYDKDIFYEEIKNYLTFKKITNSNIKKKVICIHNADYLTKDCQASLRRIIEQYSEFCFFIFLIKDLSKLDNQLISRSIIYNFNLPKDNEFNEYINTICKNENIILNRKNIDKLISMKNINKILYAIDEILIEGKYNDYINLRFKKISKILLNNFDLTRIIEVRTILYDFLIMNFDFQYIVSNICDAILKKIKNNNIKIEIITISSKISGIGLNGLKKLYYLEYLCISIVNILKKNNIKEL
jgi:DNA polymerase III delta prime subunit